MIANIWYWLSSFRCGLCIVSPVKCVKQRSVLSIGVSTDQLVTRLIFDGKWIMMCSNLGSPWLSKK